MIRCNDCGAPLIGARTRRKRVPLEPEPCPEGTMALRIGTTAPPFAIQLEHDEEFTLARNSDDPLFSPHRCKSKPNSQDASPNGSHPLPSSDQPSAPLPPVRSPLGPMPPR